MKPLNVSINFKLANGESFFSSSNKMVEGFYLRPWQIEDAEWYVNARDEAIFRWTTEKRELTVEETQAAIEQANSDPDLVCMAIVEENTNNLLGNIALILDQDTRDAEIMYWLAPAGRGRGIATNAVRRLCAWVFEKTDIKRIRLKTHPGNFSSQAVAQRAGFISIENQATEVWFELTAPAS